MKEIIFIKQNAPQIGGVQRQIYYLATELYKRKLFQPVLIIEDANCGFAKLFAKAGFEVLAAPMRKTKILSAADKIIELIKNRDVALIQSHMFRESLIARMVRRKTNALKHILRPQTYIDGVPKTVWKRMTYHFIDRTTNRWVDLYIANGKYMADEIIKKSKVNPQKIRTIIDGTPPLGMADEPIKNPQQPLPPKIAMVAVFRPVKGHDCLVKALAELKKKKLPIRARLIGGASTDEERGHIEKIKALARRLDVSDMLEFYGSAEDVYAALKDIPVVVLPANSSEGTPNCILEAMSVRKLVIASEMNGVGELIEHGKTGFLHKPKDYIGFAECLEKVFKSPAADFENIRSSGLQKWRKNFTLDVMTEKFIDIYKEMGLVE